MSNRNKGTQENLTASMEELTEAFSPTQMQGLLADAGELLADRIKELKKDPDFKELNAKEKEEKLQELRLDTVTELLMAQIDKNRTFVHWDKLGYWGDKFIQGLMTVGVGVGVAAVAMKFSGKREEEAQTNAPGLPDASNPFQSTATERPIKSAREFKAS